MFWLWPLRQHTAVIRWLAPWERPAYCDHLLRLPADDRYNRFGSAVADAAIRQYCQTLDWERTAILGLFIDGQLRGAAECIRLAPAWPSDVELAFSVEAPLQGRGLGSRLFGRMLTYARNRGARRLYITCLTSNQRMRRIAGKFAMSLVPGEVGLEGRLELRPADYASYWQEAWEAGGALLAIS